MSEDESYVAPPAQDILADVAPEEAEERAKGGPTKKPLSVAFADKGATQSSSGVGTLGNTTSIAVPEMMMASIGAAIEISVSKAMKPLLKSLDDLHSRVDGLEQQGEGFRESFISPKSELPSRMQSRSSVHFGSGRASISRVAGRPRKRAEATSDSLEPVRFKKKRQQRIIQLSCRPIKNSYARSFIFPRFTQEISSFFNVQMKGQL